MPFCQSQGDDLAPTKSTIASDVAIVVVIVAIDVIIAIDVVANSDQRWSASNLITFTLSGHLWSQLASFKCLLYVILDQQSSQSGIHPLDPFGATFTLTQSFLTLAGRSTFQSYTIHTLSSTQLGASSDTGGRPSIGLSDSDERPNVPRRRSARLLRRPNSRRAGTAHSEEHLDRLARIH